MFAIALAALALAASPPASPAHAKSTRTVIKRKTRTYSYDFSWPRQASAIPALDARLRRDARESRSAVVGEAAEAYREAQADKHLWFPEAGYESSWSYDLAGQTPALLVLSGDAYSYAGGAHGMFGALAILWDRRSARPIEPIDLFERASQFAMLRPAMCKMLDAARLEKRGSEVASDFGPFEDTFKGCPKFEELTIWPSDADKDGRFETMTFTADPYVAGPYVEGEYQMDVPITRPILGAIKPRYRAGFEVHGPQ